MYRNWIENKPLSIQISTEFNYMENSNKKNHRQKKQNITVEYCYNKINIATLIPLHWTRNYKLKIIYRSTQEIITRSKDNLREYFSK